MSQLKYLDLNGLTEFWDKAKAYIDNGDADAINSVTYTNEDPTTMKVGGINVGQTFENKTIKEMFDALLYPYVAPTGATAQLVGGNGGTMEVGTSTTRTGVNTYCTRGSVDIATVTLSGATTATSEEGQISQTTNGQRATCNFTGLNISITAATPTNNVGRVTASFNDGTTTITANTGSYNFVYPYFYGASDTVAASMASDTIQAGTKNVSVEGKKTFAFTTDNQYPFIAYPASYGALAKVTDGAEVNDYTNSFGSPATISVTSADPAWGPVDYYVYTGSRGTLSNFSYVFTNG